MNTGQLRYWALGLGTGLVALGWVLDKVDSQVSAAAIAAIIGIAVADQIKHRKD